MTTIFEEEVTCAVCGSKQTVQEIGSTSSFGSMDLDTRPPPLQRGTMELWVHECTECGFVAPELRTAVDGDGRIVASAEYRAELKNASRMKLANRFVCRALLDVAAGDFVSAGWRRLHAAWACDDANLGEEARVQRLAALGSLLGPSWTSPCGPAYGGSGNVPAFPVERARALGAMAMKSVAGGDELLLADLARRSREFERAEAYCAAGMALPELPAFVTRLLLFEQGLIAGRDAGCHSVAEVEAPTAQGTVH